MAALPSVMQVKKAKMEATLPALEQVKPQPIKPVVVNVAPKEEKKEEPKEESKFDINEFTVGAPEEKKEEEHKEEPAKVEVKEDGEEDRDWRWMYKSLEGNHQLLVRENRDLRDKFVELETKFGLLGDKKVVETKPEPSLDLSKEEQEEFENALPVLNKLLAKQQRQIQETVIKPLQNEIADLKKNTSDVASRTAASDEGNFVQQVRMQVKSIPNVSADFDAILKDPKWKEFTGRPIGDYSDITIGQALWDAHKKRDLGKVVKVFEDFAKSKTTSSAGDAYRAPSVSAAAGALPDSSGKKPMLKMSKREEASVKFRKRQISAQDYEKIRDLYREAEAEGRIDYTQ
jgi:hypothetical protein